MSRRLTIVAMIIGLGLAGASCAESELPIEPDSPELAPDLKKSANQDLVTVGSTTPAQTFLVEYQGDGAAMEQAVQSVGGTLERTIGELGLAQVSGLDDAGAEDLAAGANISSVTRDLMVQWTPPVEQMELSLDGGVSGAANGTPDPAAALFFPCQWNMSQCDAESAWAAGYFGDPSKKVAVLDGGVDPFHNDLVGRVDLVNSRSMLSAPTICDDFVDDVGTFNDYNFHGTVVAGIITSNGLGVAGIAPHTQVVAVKVLSCLGNGSFGDVIAGIIYAANLPDVAVINMSLGAYFPKNAVGAGQLMAALNRAVNYAQGVKKKLVVSSAGNGDPDTDIGINLDKDGNFVHTPSMSGAGMSVWAGDIDGGLASYSNYGRSGTDIGAGGGDLTPGTAAIPLPGCVLPGFWQQFVTSVCSTTSITLPFTCGPDSYLIGNGGTSFSAPIVSGVGALVAGKYGTTNANRIKSRLIRTADDLGKKGTDGTFSHGRVNAYNAVH